MKFTKEEISLCKKVAERYRKNIYYGDWYFNERMGIAHCWTHQPSYNGSLFIPLWTVSDCLKFLRENKFIEITIEIGREDTEIYGYYTDETGRLPRRVGKTPLEACLKAVVAVLEEEGK